MVIKISQCSSNIVSRPCLSDTFIDAYVNASGAVYATLIFTNTLINPGSSEYLDYYIDDRNYITFTRNEGAISVGYL